MKAFVLHEHGGPEVLQIADLPQPQPAPGEVLVRLNAAALNRLDIWIRDGWPGIKLTYPHTLGADGAGTIAALGEGVTHWQAGDRVVINANIGDGVCEFCQAGLENLCRNWNLLGETIPGTYAEYISVPERNLLSVPDGFDLNHAAAAGLVFHTAWHSLITRGKIIPGETVLVVGASGGVNTAAIQIAKLAGAEVFVVGSSQAKLDLAAALGADHLINRSKEEVWSKSIYQLTGKRGVDVVVDNVGVTFHQSMRAARKGGRILTVGNTGAPKFEFDNRYMFGKHLSLIGSTMGTLDDFRRVMKLVFAGKLSAVVDRVFPFDEAASAHRKLDQGDQLGKIVLEI